MKIKAAKCVLPRDVNISSPPKVIELDHAPASLSGLSSENSAIKHRNERTIEAFFKVDDAADCEISERNLQKPSTAQKSRNFNRKRVETPISSKKQPNLSKFSDREVGTKPASAIRCAGPTYDVDIITSSFKKAGKDVKNGVIAHSGNRKYADYGFCAKKEALHMEQKEQKEQIECRYYGYKKPEFHHKSFPPTGNPCDFEFEGRLDSSKNMLGASYSSMGRDGPKPSCGNHYAEAPGNRIGSHKKFPSHSTANQSISGDDTGELNPTTGDNWTSLSRSSGAINTKDKNVDSMTVPRFRGETDKLKFLLRQMGVLPHVSLDGTEGTEDHKQGSNTVEEKRYAFPKYMCSPDPSNIPIPGLRQHT